MELLYPSAHFPAVFSVISALIFVALFYSGAVVSSPWVIVTLSLDFLCLFLSFLKIPPRHTLHIAGEAAGDPGRVAVRHLWRFCIVRRCSPIK